MATAFEQLSSKLVDSRRISIYGAAVELKAYLFARLPILQQLVGEEGTSLDAVVRSLIELHDTQLASTSGGSAGNEVAEPVTAGTSSAAGNILT
jgi:hypothetical protein